MRATRGALKRPDGDRAATLRGDVEDAFSRSQTMDKIRRGVEAYRTRIFPQQAALFKTLEHGQKPRALFITCSDSRIDPDLITQTEPGELFVLRNAGNIVAPFSGWPDGEAATIEYAIEALKVPHIIVCGHSHCGAMQALLSRDAATTLPSVSLWLGHAEAARRAVLARNGTDVDAETLRAFVEENVRLQLVHLRTHPAVAAALARGAVELHGWLYVFEQGQILTMSHDGAFQPIAIEDGQAPSGVELRWTPTDVIRAERQANDPKERQP